MRKQSRLIKSERGFFLPLVFVISFIILLFIVSIIKIYQSELNITKNLIEQLETDTIIQMSLEKLKDDLVIMEENEGEVTYTFPNQIKANILFKWDQNDYLKLDYKIYNSNNSTYEVVQFYRLEDLIISE